MTIRTRPLLLTLLVIAAIVGAAVWWRPARLPAGPSPVMPSTQVGAAVGASAGGASQAAAPVKLSAAWLALTPAQKSALAPLADSWGHMSQFQRDKWLAIARRYHKLSPAGRDRLHERMRAWLRLTPQQKRIARENYLNAKSLPPDAKAEAWKKYQQLSEAQKKRLAAEYRDRKRPSVVTAPPSGKPGVQNPYDAVHRRAAQAASAPAAASALPASAPAALPSSPPSPVNSDLYQH